MNKKRKMMIAFTLVAVLLVSIVGTYAYFTSGINNDKPQSAVLKTGSMALTFEDNDAGINEKLMFGESVVKKFKIINTGTLEASLSLDFDRMINTYLHGSLSYKLSYSSEEEGEYEEIIPETNMPVSSEPLTQTLAQELSVPAGDTYYYNLTITLNVTDFDQTDDRDAVYNTRFNVGDSIKYRYYSLIVDPNGGTLGEYTSPQEYILKNKEVLDIKETPVKIGHTFLGWKMVGVSSTFRDGTFMMGISDAKLIAQWNINKHTVTINKGEEVTTIETEYGKIVDLGEPSYKEGYTFTGWESTGGVIEGNNLIITEDKDITVTPTYVINRYKYIVYHRQENINDEEYTLVGADTDEGEADYNSTVSPEVKTYTGFTSPSVKSLTIKHETAYPPVLNKVDYNYDRNRYTLTVNANGGIYTGATSQELKYEQSFTLTSPTKTGYNFTNWTTTSGRVDGSMFTMETDHATVTANYTPKQFTVTFNANGGSTPTASKIVSYDSTYGDLPTPTYSGYTFLGWYTTASGGTQVTENSTISLTDNQTLFARWKKNVTDVAGLISLANPISNTNYSDGNPKEMYAFTQPATKQTPTQTDYRYLGSDPNNYIVFNDESWRIIGVFPVKASSNGTYENRIKIMKTTSIGSLKYSSVKNNIWKNGAMANYLNKDYFSGLTNAAKGQIEDTEWFLGAAEYQNFDGNTFYTYERGNKKIEGGNQEINIVQKVGLIYPSDYVYTFANKVNSTCFGNGYSCNENSGGKPMNSWMYKDILKNQGEAWTITPRSNVVDYSIVIAGGGSTERTGVEGRRATIPTVYLKNGIVITDGDGSSENPYKIK